MHVSVSLYLQPLSQENGKVPLSIQKQVKCQNFLPSNLGEIVENSHFRSIKILIKRVEMKITPFSLIEFRQKIKLKIYVI